MPSATKTIQACALAAALALPPAMATAAEGMRLEGDIGLAVLHTPSEVRGERARYVAVPYVSASYGPLFARIDTFGLQVLPLGYGHVEVVGQIRSDGYDAVGLQHRRDATPLGIGTLQITPVGAFGLHVLRDFGRSGGTLAQLRYLAELRLGRLTIYPEFGAEYQSRAYTGYYAGTTAADAAFVGRDYQPRAAVNPYLGALVEIPLRDRWYTNVYLRRTVVDDTIARSPLVANRHRDSGLIALAYRF